MLLHGQPNRSLQALERGNEWLAKASCAWQEANAVMPDKVLYQLL
jgi:hypothetical protein